MATDSKGGVSHHPCQTPQCAAASGDGQEKQCPAARLPEAESREWFSGLRDRRRSMVDAMLREHIDQASHFWNIAWQRAKVVSKNRSSRSRRGESFLDRRPRVADFRLHLLKA